MTVGQPINNNVNVVADEGTSGGTRVTGKFVYAQPLYPLYFGKEQPEVSVVTAKDTFIHSNPKERLTITAELKDGQKLPGWITFEDKSMVLRAVPPGRNLDNVTVVIKAEDEAGAVATTTIRLQLRDAR